MMRAVSDSGRRSRDTESQQQVTERRFIGHHPAKYPESRDQSPGAALIAGGFSSLGHGSGGLHGHRTARRREAARVAAPLAVPVALGVTLGVILAVSSGPSRTHVTQDTRSGTSTTSTSASAVPSPNAARPSATNPSVGRPSATGG